MLLDECTPEPFDWRPFLRTILLTQLSLYVYYTHIKPYRWAYQRRDRRGRWTR